MIQAIDKSSGKKRLKKLESSPNCEEQKAIATRTCNQIDSKKAAPKGKGLHGSIPPIFGY
jgi:hypothetical protein